GARSPVPAGGGPDRLPRRRADGRRRGRGAGGLPEGVLRAAPVPGRRPVPPLAAGHRGERGPEPAQVGGSAGTAGPAGGTGPPLGGCGPIPRGGGAGGGGEDHLAGGGEPTEGARPHGHRLPVSPRPVREGDRLGARGAGRDGEVPPGQGPPPAPDDPGGLVRGTLRGAGGRPRWLTGSGAGPTG